jgi:hypothetical protein
MYPREQAQQMRKLFWISLGKYMGQFPSVFNPKVKWLNYKTGVQHLYFRLDLDNKQASVSIEMEHPDPGIRELFYQQWEQVDGMLFQATDQSWTWVPETYNESGLAISRIYVTLPDVSIYDDTTWGTAFSFISHYMIRLDELWAELFDLFEDFAE